MAPLAPETLKMILAAEGLDQPGEWPGGESGITIGIGYDLGYCTAEQFDSDWSAIISELQRTRLKTAIGVKGDAAKNMAAQFKDIIISRADSEKVFVERSVPQQQQLTATAFPGFENLPKPAQDALVSLTYNRGTSMTDKPGQDRRREMRAIRDAVAKNDLKEIATQLRSMKRLWQGQNMGGLLKRRDAEAALVDSCIA